MVYERLRICTIFVLLPNASLWITCTESTTTIWTLLIEVFFIFYLNYSSSFLNKKLG